MSKTATRRFFKEISSKKMLFKKKNQDNKKKSSGKPNVRQFLDAFLKSKNEKDYSRELFPKKFQARKFSKQKKKKIKPWKALK